ncbi:PKD domain-containing protein, partial [Chloroflexota bacterium]
MTKNTIRKAIGIIMVASLLILIVAQALYPTRAAALTSPGNLLYDPFDDDTTLGEIRGTVSFAPSGDNGQGFDMGQSVYFDGEGAWEGYILYGTEGPPSPFVTNPGTLELWVRKDSWALPSGSKEDILRTNTSNIRGIHLSLFGPMGFPYYMSTLRLWSQSNTPAVIYNTSGLAPGWHHFAIAWNETVTYLYIDGKYINEGDGNTSVHNTLGLSVGDELNGYVDEFASYDYMKSGWEIEQDFKAISSPHIIPEPPIADANEPYSGYEGSAITFDGSSSSDPDGTIVAYDWDLDDDSLFDDATGEIASYTWGDDYAGNIGLKVTDNNGLSDTDTTTVTVSNVAPIVEAGADQTVTQGDMVSLSGSFTDPGLLDTHTIHW